MKNYFIRAIVSAVAYTIVYLLLDIVFGNMHSFREYAFFPGICNSGYLFWCSICVV